MAARSDRRGDSARFSPGACLILPALRLLMPVLVVAAYLGGLFGLWQWERYSGTAVAAVSEPLGGGSAPDWLGARELRRISRLGSAVAGRSIYDPGLASDLGASYLTSPWVRRVVSIRREFPDKVDVILELRRPVAYVKSTRYYPVDREGVRIPVMPQKLDRAGVPLITGIPGSVPAVGDAWSSEALADALDALGALRRHLERSEHGADVCVREVSVAAAELPGAGRTTDVEFLTGGGMKIVWGRHSREDAACFGQISTEEKLAELDAQLAVIARIGRRARYVNVSFRPGVYRLADG